MSARNGLDELFMERAYELAARGIGNTIPNPCVGAVLVRVDAVVGEGYHQRDGGPHAEIEALKSARGNAQGATAYVTLEPCFHGGRTGSCASALIQSGIKRVVIGTLDSNPATHGKGVALLREAGVAVEVREDRRARRLVEQFAFAIGSDRSYVALKMAMSLDGRIAAVAGKREMITGEPWRLRVSDLRFAHDAVMVGAGTVRVDDPQLTVRPPRHRLRPFTRIVACETAPVPASSRVFAEVEDYARTLVLAPAGARERFAELEGVAELAFVGDDRSTTLDLAQAMQATRALGVQSILCEGGPTLGARLIAAGLVERVYWAIAPRFLTSPQAVPVLAGADLANLGARLRFDSLEHIGEDVMLSGRFDRV